MHHQHEQQLNSQVCNLPSMAPAACRHTDWVTAVQFHPTNDAWLLSTSVDGKVSRAPRRLFLAQQPEWGGQNDVRWRAAKASADIVCLATRGCASISVQLKTLHMEVRL